MHFVRRIGVTLVLCACGGAPSQHVEYAPLPPGPGEPAVAPSDAAAAPASLEGWPALPAIEAVPASHPTGAPIALPADAPKPGRAEHQILARSSEMHSVNGSNTRFQRTETSFDLEVKVLEVVADHASKLEVAATTATESIALADKPTKDIRDFQTLLVGTYIVTAGRGGGFERDEANVTRGAGMAVYGREQEELGELFGEELRDGNPIARFIRGKTLRIGEAIPLPDDAKHLVAGNDPLPGTFTLSLTAADANTATYVLDVDVVAMPDPMSDHGTQDLRVRDTLVFDRATGRLLEQREQQRKHSHDADSTEDTFSSATIKITPGK